MPTGKANNSLPPIQMKAYGPMVARPLPAKHPFYSLIGRVASEWAHLEHALDETIWELTQLPLPLAPCLTSQLMGVRPRCQAIILLGEQCLISEKTLKGFNTLKNDSFGPADLRARIVHDPCYMFMGEKIPAQFRAMPYSDRRYGPQEITEEEILETMGKITALKDRAITLRDTVADELKALK